MKQKLLGIWRKTCSLKEDSDGFVMMLTLSIFLFLFVLCSSIYAIGETIHQKIRLQNACDAAAYSAAVVQADGLSRMATINRAMAWTYVQMTNHQMEYINYRWLRLIAQRFQEDYDNAREYHRWIVASFNPEYGWWAILGAVADALTGRLAGAKCNQYHELEGIGWWCGQKADTEKKIKLNGHLPASLSYDELISHIQNLASFMDDDDPPGSLVGKETSTENSDADDAFDRKRAEMEDEIKRKTTEIQEKYRKLIEKLDTEDPDFETDKQTLLEQQEQEIGKMEQEVTAKYEELLSDYIHGENQNASDRKTESDSEKTSGSSESGTDEKTFSEEETASLIEQIPEDSLISRIDSPDILRLEYETRTWGENLGKMIDADKENIALLNTMLSVVNRNMNMAMRSIAEFVLVNMLRDPRGKAEDAMKNYIAYFFIPQGQDPYSTDTADATVSQSFFSPLYNTEACERLFLHMNSPADASEPLYKLFPVMEEEKSDKITEVLNQLTATQEKAGYGLDQWFIRGTRNTDPAIMATTIRSEGALGLQRVYKDSNLNETQAGIRLLDQPVDRGNHIANLYQSVGNLTGGSGGEESAKLELPEEGNLFKKILDPLLELIIGSLASEYCDITASAGNTKKTDQHIGMCLEDSNTVALYADYDWASAKWICINRPRKFPSFWVEYLYCSLVTGDCRDRRIFCDLGSIKHKRGKWGPRVRHYGYGHYHFPKWFCGTSPKYQFDDAISESVAHYLLLDIIPPIFPSEAITGNRHGYMKKTMDWQSFVRPSSPLLGKNLETRRTEYESCAGFPDAGPTEWNFVSNGKAAIIKGHARIYGDDKEIWNDRYIGETAKPWVLNEKFFAGQGTIVIGVAMKHRNPFVQLFHFWGSSDQEMDGRNVLSAFDPPTHSGIRYQGKRIPSNNYIWTMSAARAAVRRARRNGPYDQERMYQIVYDPTSDPQNLTIRNPFFYDSSGTKEWKKYDSGKASTVHDPGKPTVLGGCVCSADNAGKFQIMWNLCEQDWDATLLPLRYAGSSAVLQDRRSGNSTVPFPEMNYKERLDFLKTVNLQEYTGNGENWLWTPSPLHATDLNNQNPLNPADSEKSWQPLDPQNTDTLNLENLLPGGTQKLNLNQLLKQNKVL